MAAVVDDRIETFKGFLTTLWRTQSKAWNYVPTTVSDVYNTVVGQFPPMDEKALEAIIPTDAQVEGNSSAGHRYLYLPPLDKDSEFIPLMSFHYDFKDKAKPAMKFSLHLLTMHNRELRSIGYRIETPHGSGKQEPGAHDFHHAQLCREYMGGGGKWHTLPNCPEWLPTTQPSFPLPARDYVELFVCLLISLYGGHWLQPLQAAGIHKFASYAKMPALPS